MVLRIDSALIRMGGGAYQYHLVRWKNNGIIFACTIRSVGSVLDAWLIGRGKASRTVADQRFPGSLSAVGGGHPGEVAGRKGRHPGFVQAGVQFSPQWVPYLVSACPLNDACGHAALLRGDAYAWQADTRTGHFLADSVLGIHRVCRRRLGRRDGVDGVRCRSFAQEDKRVDNISHPGRGMGNMARNSLLSGGSFRQLGFLAMRFYRTRPHSDRLAIPQQWAPSAGNGSFPRHDQSYLCTLSH